MRNEFCQRYFIVQVFILRMQNGRIRKSGRNRINGQQNKSENTTEKIEKGRREY